nr:integrase, catalytic region, zinc finger, CCHC-type, peptidase aspartic, catalytic [Tanacetum cinerariifolium]
MTGDRSRLKNFMKKFIRTVRFGNDHFGAIMGYEDYVIGDSVIFRVYNVEGLGHNLFSVRQFYDSGLEVAFRKHSYYVRDTDGVELIKGSRGSNLYTISVEDMMKSSPICLLSKASKNKSWLWHQYYANVGIFHQKSVSRTPQQNGIIERQNHTLVEAARTMLIFSKALMFLWAAVVATAYQEMKQQIILFEEDKRMFLAKNEFLEKVSSSMQKEYNDLLASNDVIKQRLETKFKFLKHNHFLEKMFEMIEQEYESNVLKISITISTIETKNLELIKEIGDKVKCFDDEKNVFKNKISKLENDLAQRVKDFYDVKTELSRRTDKFETYFSNLEKETDLLKS